MTKKLNSLTRPLSRLVVGAALMASSGAMAQTYCPSVANYSWDTGLDEVILSGNSMTINANSAGVCGDYTDNTSMIADLSLSSTYTLNITQGTCGSTQYGKTGKVYIDWNGDFDFDDAGEEIATLSVWQYGVAPSQESITFSVPATAAIGMTRMRITVQETTSPAGVGPCNTFWYGETEDYTIDIQSFALDAGISAMPTPSYPTCALDSNITAVLSNAGSNTLTSATVVCEINGVQVSSMNWAGSLLQAETDTLSLVTQAINDGDEVVVYVTSPNGSVDQNPASDTLSKTLFSALSGTYVVGASAMADFVDVDDAVTAMNTFGTCGDVTFEIEDGSYTGAYDVSSHWRNDSTDVLTFKSQSGIRDNVVLTNLGVGPNYIFFVNNSEGITFEDMTMQAYAANGSVSIDLGLDVENVTVDNIAFANGTAPGGWFWTVSDYASISSDIYTSGPEKIRNVTVTDCSFDNVATGIHLENIDDLEVMNCDFTTSEYGVYAYKGVGLEIMHSSFESAGSVNAWNSMGVYAYNFRDVEIASNYFLSGDAGMQIGMQLSNVLGTLNNPAKIYNNRMRFTGTDPLGGIYVYNCAIVDVVHNNIALEFAAPGGFGFAVDGANTEINFNNNIIAGNTASPAMEIYNMTGVNSNYNSIYSAGGVANLGGFGGTVLNTIADWQGASNMDSNSIEVMMPFADTMMRVCNDSLFAMGMYNSMYNMDFDGDMRMMGMTSIGADEFRTGANFHIDSEVLCDGDTLDYIANYFQTVVWNGTDTSNTISVFAPGNYTVELMGACGTFNDTLVVMGQQASTLPATVNICADDSAMIATGIVGTYAWSTGHADSAVSVIAPGTLSVMVTDMYGCVTNDTVQITQSTNVDLPDSVITFCEGGSVYLDADMAGTYNWSNTQTNQVIQVSQGGMYSVEVTDNYGCVSSDTAEVEEVLLPVAGGSVSVSYASVYTTNGSANATDYSWDFGDGQTSTDENPYNVYGSNGVYTIVLTATNQCGMDTTSFQVSIEVSSVEDLADVANWSTYPNPVEGELNVSIDAVNALNAEVKVLSIDGKLISTVNQNLLAGANNFTVNTASLAKGIYLLQIQIGNEFVQQKIIKK